MEKSTKKVLVVAGVTITLGTGGFIGYKVIKNKRNRAEQARCFNADNDILHSLNEIKDAENAKLRTLKQLQEAEQTKIKAFDEAKKIIDNATIQAYQQKEQIQLEAKNIADKTRAAAESEAIKIKENMKNEMRKQIIDIAFDVSSSLLKEKVTQDDTEKFVDDFIQTLSEQKSSNK